MITPSQLNSYKLKLLSPWSLYVKPLDQYKIVDGYLMHRDAHTRIGGMKTQGEKFNIYFDSMLDNLKKWHEFAESFNIIYTLIASNLIGYYCSRGMLPWEDDIDLTVRQKDWKLLTNMYAQLPRCDDIEREFPELCTSFEPRQIPGSELYICRHKKSPGKMKIVNHDRFIFYTKYKTPGKMRGIDICCSIPYNNNCIESFWAYRDCFPVCPGPANSMGKDECPVVNFHGVSARVIIRKFAEPYLVSRYGTKWGAMIQPRLINKTAGIIPCRDWNREERCDIKTIINEICV